jgi:hypothetical protein
MVAIGPLFIRMLCDRFKPRQQLETEILVLRHQLNVLRQLTPRRPRCGGPIVLYSFGSIIAVRPETVVRWHRMGFAAYWRWRSRSPGGRPRVAKEVRDLIRRMSLENPFWGATKIHGELLRLGIHVAQSTVSIYMVPRCDRPLQTWKTFLRNHMERIASIDLALSKRICRTLDRLDPARVHRSSDRAQRRAPATNSCGIRDLLSTYYNDVRTHVSLGKDAPCRRSIERCGHIVAYPILGGLHHQYARIEFSEALIARARECGMEHIEEDHPTDCL